MKYVREGFFLVFVYLLIGVAVVAIGTVVVVFTLKGASSLMSLNTKQIAENLRGDNEIVFAGKIVNQETGEWPNNRLVLIYLHGEEVGRAISSTGKFAPNELGILDGLFTIPVTNTYELTEDSMKVDEEHSIISGTYRGNLFQWFELEEGSELEIHVPTKNLNYIIKSFYGDVSELPKELLVNRSTRLIDNEIIVSLREDNPVKGQAAVIDKLGDMQNIQFNAESHIVTLEAKSYTLDNCAGSVVVTREDSKELTLIHKYEVEIGGEVGTEVSIPVLSQLILPKLIVALGGKYGYQQGQVETQTVSYYMGADPGTHQKYTVSLQEIWETGEAQTTLEKTMITVPFQVLTALNYDVKAESLGCD